MQDLDPSSNASDVRRAYLQKCLRWHPDKNQATRESEMQASTMFKAVSEANRVLSDPVKRAAYDTEHVQTKRMTRTHSAFDGDTFPPSRKFQREMSPTGPTSRKSGDFYEE